MLGLHIINTHDRNWFYLEDFWASQMALVVKNSLANAGDLRDKGSIPGLGRYPGGRHGNLLQYSCLENLMDRGAWWATVHGVTKSWIQLKQLSTMHAQRCMIVFRYFKVVW